MLVVSAGNNVGLLLVGGAAVFRGLVNEFDRDGPVVASPPERQGRILEDPVVCLSEFGESCVPVIGAGVRAREAEVDEVAPKLEQQGFDLVIIEKACSGQSEAE